MFDWEDLRHFSTLARRKSVSAAARELNVDHATVSRRVSSLERELNLKLVDRRPRSYELTDMGEQVARLANSAEEAALKIERLGASSTIEMVGSVSISAPPGIASRILAPHVAKLRLQHPGINVRLIGEKRSVSLARREADIAVRIGRPTEHSLVARKLSEFSFGLYGSSEYLARCQPEQWTFIAYDENSDDLPQQKWLLEFASNRPVVLRTNDLEIQLAAVQAGIGLAILPDFFIKPAHVENVTSVQPSLSREIWLLVHRDMCNSPLVRAVMDFVSTSIKDSASDSCRWRRDRRKRAVLDDSR